MVYYSHFLTQNTKTKIPLYELTNLQDISIHIIADSAPLSVERLSDLSMPNSIQNLTICSEQPFSITLTDLLHSLNIPTHLKTLVTNFQIEYNAKAIWNCLEKLSIELKLKKSLPGNMINLNCSSIDLKFKILKPHDIQIIETLITSIKSEDTKITIDCNTNEHFMHLGRSLVKLITSSHSKKIENYFHY